ncbi:rhodanese/Cell cycle control phosphatase superfamily protein [Artemisia annua]|uniref:Rhodanese/Cell cycle control phosphatase superfamily protein n=1 Tax=Artemisia annua TaxID=35608 RepID=A0A2U1PME6_ARTAN|nr:rhodanese/Cell cycle control phosphatase superfamily protein [Artemisia annua]
MVKPFCQTTQQDLSVFAFSVIYYISNIKKQGLFDVEGSIELKDVGKAGLVQVQLCKGKSLLFLEPYSSLSSKFTSSSKCLSGLFYGIPFTKPNTEFVQSAKSQFSPDSKILVVCQEGLTYRLFDVEGSIELKDVGKAGLVQVQLCKGKSLLFLEPYSSLSSKFTSSRSLQIYVHIFSLLILYSGSLDQAEKIIALLPSS